MTPKALADLWRQARSRAYLYKATRDPGVRAEAASLLWQSLVQEGAHIARRKLPLGRAGQALEVAEDAAASLVAKEGFTLLLQTHDAGKGATLRSWLARRMEMKIQNYAATDRWYDTPPSGLGGGAPDDSDGDASVEDVYGAQHQPVYEQSAFFDIDRAFANREFWRVAQHELTTDELEALVAYLVEATNDEAAASLALAYGTFMDRMARVRVKLGRVYRTFRKNWHRVPAHKGLPDDETT